MKKIMVVLVMFVTIFAGQALAQAPKDSVSTETKELVRRLLEANGMRESLLGIFEDIISQAPPESQKELHDVLKADAIIDSVIPVYAKYFTQDELRALITFYKSPVGVKNLGLTPKLMTEVMQTAGQYFEEKTKNIVLPEPAAPKAAQ
ncbi:MAG: DUF2059 domain-containing protein [Candidatus Omnitrophica bacterium]|nr:DUF2059 domain-containing protein [Candidatus Omnitrophota bacterium]